MVLEIVDKAHFWQAVEEANDDNKLYVIVDFTASWCGPCRMISPIFEELSEKYGKAILFVKVDVDRVHDVATEFGISGMPTFVLLKGRDVVDKLVGANPQKLTAIVEAAKEGQY